MFTMTPGHCKSICRLRLLNTSPLPAQRLLGQAIARSSTNSPSCSPMLHKPYRTPQYPSRITLPSPLVTKTSSLRCIRREAHHRAPISLRSLQTSFVQTYHNIQQDQSEQAHSHNRLILRRWHISRRRCHLHPNPLNRSLQQPPVQRQPINK